MQGGIVDADNGDFAAADGNEGGLVDQEGDFVAVGEFAILIDRYAAVVIVVAERHEDRRDLPQGCEKSKQMRQPLRHVEEVAGDKNPVGVKSFDSGDDTIVPWLITIEVQIAEVNGSPSGHGAMPIGES